MILKETISGYMRSFRRAKENKTDYLSIYTPLSFLASSSACGRITKTNKNQMFDRSQLRITRAKHHKPKQNSARPKQKCTSPERKKRSAHQLLDRVRQATAHLHVDLSASSASAFSARSDVLALAVGR
jgi:hypothetical protein